MKKKINLSISASLSNFSQEKNEKFSRATVNICNDGLTEDKRKFSKTCLESLKKSLPYTPIVSRYDSEEEDFEGHAFEQNIYGIVDPTKEPVDFTDENGKTWIQAEAVLYTERPDSTGEIAKKIKGQPHSLEMDPNTVKYKFVYDEKKHFKYIEFTYGEFVGLSVLGKNQKPAFAGSSFFSYDEDFENKMNLLKNYCERKNELEGGSTEMNIEDFRKLSYGELYEKIKEAIYKEYESDGYPFVRDFYDDSVVFELYYFSTNEHRLLQSFYTVEGDNIKFGKVQEVYVTYLPVEKGDESSNENYSLENAKKDDEESKCIKDDEDESKCAKEEDEESKCAKDEDEESKCAKDEDEESKCAKDEDITDKKENCEEKDDVDDIEDKNDDIDDKDDKKDDFQNVEQTTNDSTAEFTENKMKVSAEDEQNVNNEKSDSNVASFSEGERAEYEALKRESKQNLINEYSVFLNEEELNNFNANIDNFTKDELELELLKAYKRNSSVASTNGKNKIFAFTPKVNYNNNSDEDALTVFIRKNLKR